VLPDSTNQLGPGLAEGRACIYCGGPGPTVGSLVPLRPSVRAATWCDDGPLLAALGQLFPDIRVRRCEPPCREALRAYREGFAD
jgi:hypothetical protein